MRVESRQRRIAFDAVRAGLLKCSQERTSYWINLTAAGMHKVLTIAGSIPAEVPGIQADLKTILSLGGYGMSVVTAVTAQNTLGVQGVMALDPDFVALQLQAVLEDIGADCIKTGMLANAGIVEVVAKKISESPIEKVVVDPVLASESGVVLLVADGKDALVRSSSPSRISSRPTFRRPKSLPAGKSPLCRT